MQCAHSSCVSSLAANKLPGHVKLSNCSRGAQGATLCEDATANRCRTPRARCPRPPGGSALGDMSRGSCAACHQFFHLCKLCTQLRAFHALLLALFFLFRPL